jgi:hypothetical protein
MFLAIRTTQAVYASLKFFNLLKYVFACLLQFSILIKKHKPNLYVMPY